MKFIKYLFLTILIFIILGTFIILNLGNFLDISEAPKKSDVIVSLGGGDLDRVKKSLELYKKDFSTKNILILTGNNENINDPRIKYIKTNNTSKINIIETFDTKNTYEEMIFIKKFLIEKNYTSAIIVSDAPHSKRISYLLNTIKIENSSNLEFNIVSSSGQWWNKELYYKNIRARIFAALEGLKLLSSYFRYGIIEKIGMTDIVDELLPPVDQEFKKQTEKYLYKYLN
jgi:uncharacterized SAM-binding protein YcdF (DUF218 family)